MLLATVSALLATTLLQGRLYSLFTVSLYCDYRFKCVCLLLSLSIMQLEYIIVKFSITTLHHDDIINDSTFLKLLFPIKL